VTALSGRAIYFYRCSACGFTFTRAFDHWHHSDFEKHIYNADYTIHDPEYANNERGERTAFDLIRTFGFDLSNLSILDWGAGQGGFSETLLKNGFSRVDSYDPFSINAARYPSDLYDVVTCFEVYEHVLEPVTLTSELAARRNPSGAILISTLCCTQQVVDFGLENWHYCVPRNGHISFMTPESLQVCAKSVGLCAYSFSVSAHVMFDPLNTPAWLTNRITGKIYKNV
jgi:2-polyprenyl-3-methyl-5-hydroxy-6-metoxy-1,4-benzoquinol methylase